MPRTWINRVAVLVGIGLLFFVGSTRAWGIIAAPRLTGAQVTAVAAGSPANWVGLEPGDIIVGIDGQPVRTLADIPRLLGPRRWALLLVRDVRTGQYVQAWAAPRNGRIGVQLAMTVVPEFMLPLNIATAQRVR